MALTEKLTELPEQIVCEAAGCKLIAGNPNTFAAVVVLLQFVVESVKIKVGLPTATPVTRPVLSTVARALLLLAHVPPEFGVN